MYFQYSLCKNDGMNDCPLLMQSNQVLFNKYTEKYMSVGMEIENETIPHQRHLAIMSQCQGK